MPRRITAIPAQKKTKKRRRNHPPLPPQNPHKRRRTAAQAATHRATTDHRRKEQNLALARGFVKKHFVEQGMCADLCVHDDGKGNPHAHVLLTLCPFTESGAWDDKQRKEYILDGNGENLKTHWERIADLKVRAKVLVFLTSNDIADVEQLASKVERMHRRQYEVANRIKAIDRRKEKLTEHLAQVDIRKQHMAVNKKYKGLDPKKRSAYLQKHADEIERYESAAKYLKDHLNGYGKIPEKEWRTEQDRLIAERYGLCEEYYKLKDDVKSVETLRRNTENIMRESALERTQTRTKDMEL